MKSTGNLAQGTQSVPEERITFWGEVKKGRDWLVFVWQMVGRLDSPVALLRALGTGVGALLMIVPKSIRCALLKLGIVKD
ncbi:hypothetical protein [Gloeobacter kilaueensis]|uniref:Uncharacterized protein n=1 Tax=Gloeobacter kilaueensis (strain ATCC BAA-2537 / CCAP 1431/1 / ULC 316 / JS1) TaxID=1183438 RepID=U5QNA7_GLOK1|nr:hypothetical protein [Gloeobacter kilaueensis]AGY60472.1 hypothetical protein GKIL_4226 [Gloeobacter kilaueensis JS1]